MVKDAGHEHTDSRIELVLMLEAEAVTELGWEQELARGEDEEEGEGL